MEAKTEEMGAFTPLKPGNFKAAHRCKIDRTKSPPTTSDDMLSIEGVPFQPELVRTAHAVRVNGKWFMSAGPGTSKLLEQAWEECAPPKPTV
jgi:hypothetical protein